MSTKGDDAQMEPRWLDPQERRAWRGFVRLHTDLMGHLSRQLVSSTGLTDADFRVLVVVSEAPEHRIRSRDLGRLLDWERSRLSHQIGRMEARGTVTRAPCEGDGRGFDVVLTEAGLAAIEAAAPLHLETVRHCFIDLLTPEQLDVLGDISDKVVGHLTAEHCSERGSSPVQDSCPEADCSEEPTS